MLRRLLSKKINSEVESQDSLNSKPISNEQGYIGILAGNGNLPLFFIRRAQKQGYKVFAVCYDNDTMPEVGQTADDSYWIKLGQLGALIEAFKSRGIKQVAFIGGVSRPKSIKEINLDTRGTLFLLKTRSTKDDVIMRAIADELASEGIEVVESTIFIKDTLVKSGNLTKSKPSEEEMRDIKIGIDALRCMSSQDIGQLVVVRDGVVIAVEAIEGSNATIKRGGELGGEGTVVVKFAKPTQDIRFDVPVIGINTIKTMIEAKARVLAVESGRTIMLDQEEIIELANKNNIAIIGCPALENITNSFFSFK